MESAKQPDIRVADDERSAVHRVISAVAFAAGLEVVALVDNLDIEPTQLAE